MLRQKDASMRIMLQMEEEDRETKGRDDAVQQRSDDTPTPNPTQTPTLLLPKHVPRSRRPRVLLPSFVSVHVGFRSSRDSV